MNKNIVIYSRSLGVNNRVEPSSIPYDPETGVTAFEYAENVVVGPNGKASSRKGMTSRSSDSYHSIYSIGSTGYVVKERATDAALYQIIPSSDGVLTFNGVRSGLSKEAYIDYYTIGDNTYYSNGVEHGILNNNISSAWPVSEWNGPETKTPYKSTPAGEHIAFLSGTHYFSIGNVLHATPPGLYGIYFPSLAFKKFGSKILLIVPAHDGLYIGTERRIHFLQGLEILKMQKTTVADYPIIEWSRSDDLINPFLFGLNSIMPSFIIGTAKGPAICLPGGQLEDLISKNIKLPACTGAGATLCVDETLIFQSRGD